MRLRTMFAALFLPVMLIAMYSTEASATKKRNGALSEEKMTFLEILVRICISHDCYFTIESVWVDVDDEPMNAIESRLIAAPQKATGLQEALDNLKVAAPNVIFTIDQTNDRIIHVIDVRLLKREGYALAQVVKNIDFTGTVDDLLTFIGTQGIPIGLMRFMDLREARIQDRRTPVHVKGKNLPVRSVLSNYIPLEGRNRFIWMARTRLEKGEITRVMFRK
jgi:hypothetical protein